MGKKSVPPTLFPHHTDGEKECTPHSFSPLYRWRERVSYTLFPLQYGGNLKMYPTLFFPIIEGKKLQRVRNSTEPTVLLSITPTILMRLPI